MYDWPEVRAGFQELWTGVSTHLAKAGIDAPSVLAHTQAPFDHWLSERLFLSQTCGWPYAKSLRGKVIPFARFDHGLADCAPGHYFSVFIGADSTDQKYLENAHSLLTCPALAINGADSQSGLHVFAQRLDGQPVSSIPENQRVMTGSHRNSVIAVAQGRARLAAIDAIAFELARQHEPEAATRVAVLGRSTPTPGLPLITAPANAHLAPALYEAFKEAIAGLDEAMKRSLNIYGIVPASDEDYADFISSRNA